MAEMGCSKDCTACMNEAAHCGQEANDVPEEAEEPIQEPETPATDPKSPCQTYCLNSGKLATCSDRIKWSAIHKTNTWGNPCVAAVSMVAKECPESCGQCTVKEAGCDTDTYSYRKRFDDRLELNWELRASRENRNTALVTTVAALTVLFTLALVVVGKVSQPLRQSEREALLDLGSQI